MSLYKIKVGNASIPNSEEIKGFLSESILIIVTLSAISFAISSKDGAIFLQGPHHSAKTSTKTNLSEVVNFLNSSDDIPCAFGFPDASVVKGRLALFQRIIPPFNS